MRDWRLKSVGASCTNISSDAGAMMVERLVACLLFASLATGSLGQTPNTEAPHMTQVELYEPARVAAWLKENAGKADRERARMFFQSGSRERAQRRWAPAAKS
jgi:hypothetical protein